MLTEVDELTAAVATEKVAVLLPAARLTVLGTEAEALLLERETETPPAGAAPLKLTVPMTEVPPVTLAGLTEIEESATPSLGVTDNVTVDLAVIVTSSWICPP
jgi:hypothetical protein